MIFIESQSKLERYLNEIGDLKYYALDTETTGLCPFRNRLQLVQIGTLEQQYIIDARKVNIQPLKPILENNKVQKYGANLAFDYKFFKRQGIIIENLRDIMIAEQVLKVGKLRLKVPGNYTMEGIARRRLGIELNKTIRQSFIYHKGSFSSEQLEYAADDVVIPLKIYKQQHADLISESLMPTARLEFEVIPVIGDIEYNGMYLNKEKWAVLIEENIKKYREYRQKVKDLFIPVWDLNLLGDLNMKLNNKEHVLYGLHALGFTGLENTKEESLTMNCPEEVYEPIISFREYDTDLTRYGQNWLDAINPVTGRIHTSLFQIGTECVNYESIIPTSKGLLNINELMENDNTWNDLNITVASKNGRDLTSHSYYGNIRKVTKIKTVGGHEITATPEHPVWALKWEKSYYPHPYDFDKANWYPIAELNTDSYIAISLGNNVWGNYGLDVRMAELLGMWFADGSIHDSNGSWKMRINNDDKAVQDRVKYLVNKLFGIEAKQTTPHTRTGKTSIEFGNIKLKWIQEEFNLLKGTSFKRIPKQIKKGNKQVVEAFIKGAQLDSYTRRDNKVHSVKTKLEAQWFHAAYLNLGHEAFLSQFYDKIQKNYYHKIEIKPNRKTGIVFRKIKTINEHPIKQYVFDLTVPKSHSFIANGIVSHNTGRPSSTKPNLLNVKRDKKYRNCFEAEKDGKIVTVDFEGQELRIMTELTREPKWIDYFNQGLNVHKIVGSAMFGVEAGKSDELIEIDGHKIKQRELYDITKNLNFGCLPDETKILTKDGWKHHWEVKPGIDKTLSYKDDKLKWSTIKEVCVYKDAPLQQIKKSKKAFDVLATPNHRWMKRRRTGRGKTRRYVYECNDHLTSECKLIISRESEGGNLNLTWEEGYIIGYLFTDGFITRDKFVNAPSQARGKKVKFEGIIHQKKPHERLYNVIKPYIVSSYKQKNGTMSYWLNPDYLRDLFKKANLHDELNEEFVLSLNKLARNGFCHGGLEAEGHKRGDSYAFTQNKGTTLDSFKLAFFLEGFYVTEHDNPHPDPKHNGKSKRLHLTRNEIGLQHTKPELIPGKHKVWCPVTENGTWVANYKGQYFLTGNTAYGAGPMKLMSLFLKVGVNCTMERAREIINNYKKEYPRLNKVLDNIAVATAEEGFSTSLGGRKRYFDLPEIDQVGYKKHKEIRAAIMREGRNHAVQGSGADMLKRSLVTLRNRIRKEQRENDLKIILCPYDETVGESYKDHEYHKQMIEECMLLGQEYYQEYVPAAVEGNLEPYWTK